MSENPPESEPVPHEHDDPDLAEAPQGPADWDSEPGSDERLNDEARERLADDEDE